jgi:hypothetical protein
VITGCAKIANLRTYVYTRVHLNVLRAESTSGLRAYGVRYGLASEFPFEAVTYIGVCTCRSRRILTSFTPMPRCG